MYYGDTEWLFLNEKIGKIVPSPMGLPPLGGETGIKEAVGGTEVAVFTISLDKIISTSPGPIASPCT